MRKYKVECTNGKTYAEDAENIEFIYRGNGLVRFMKDNKIDDPEFPSSATVYPMANIVRITLVEKQYFDWR